ncbi:MAG: acetyl-CoA acetyltransferase [Myxococcales bacterium]|nr:acetyl-CoA acetyltransferase [Myxococcales bacterium]
MALDPSTPVLIGAGQVTDRNTDLDRACSRLDLMEAAARLAAEDARLPAAALARLERVVVIPPFPRDWMDNPPEALAARLDCSSARGFVAAVGGCFPQALVNQSAEAIARGQLGFVLLAGAEAEDTRARFRKRGDKPTHWRVESETRPETIDEVDGSVVTSRAEAAHGLGAPAIIYPMFETALRHHYGRSIEDHRQRMGSLCASLARVAADNPLAWFQQAPSPDEITLPSDDNRYVAYPYTKRMNAMPRVNQAATLLMTSVERARAMGVPEERRVFLHGCGDAHDHWHVSRRVDYHSSPAIRAIGQTALSMAGLGIGDIDALDIYSCFPVAVEIGRDMLGIAEDDPRPLTVTGGLPYFGGPGNNFAMHSIATMMDRLRAQPGTTGLVTGNSYYLSKHSVGIYSTRPAQRRWQRRDPAEDQARVDAEPGPEVAEQPDGIGAIEAYSVGYNREREPERGYVLGRLEDGRRFVAHTVQDPAVLASLVERDAVGVRGRVTSEGELNRFAPL